MLHMLRSSSANYALMDSRCIDSTKTYMHLMKNVFLVARVQLQLAGSLVPGLRVVVVAALLQSFVAASPPAPVSTAGSLLGSFAPCS